MRSIQRNITRVFLTVALNLCALTVSAQQQPGALRGRVLDERGDLIVGARVAVRSATGVERVTATDGGGRYTVSGLEPGKYLVRVSAPGFAVYENPDLEVAVGQIASFDITLSVASVEQEVTIAATHALSTDPENNAGALVLGGAELEALPDDPDELASALQALAGPSAGPNGGQIFIDGFASTSLPPKDSIRELRINQNPFSAEFDRIGLGRIDVVTKPGADKFRGQGFFNFVDESLNSRNPFSPRRVPSQERFYGGSLSGPVSPKKASLFFNIERREANGNVIVNATTLDPELNITPFNQAVLTTNRRTTLASRLDYQLDKKNTLVGRYSFNQAAWTNFGVSELTLPSRAYDTSNTEHTVQLTETAIINQQVINETRFQYVFRRARENGDNSTPTINILDAFIGGGAPIGLSFNNEDRWEVQNYTLYATGNHALRIGVRLRGVHITDSSSSNFGGTYVFSGGAAPQLDVNNRVVFDDNGQPRLISITSIERYRRTLLFQWGGVPPEQVRALGGGASQFSLTSGNPVAQVSQTDFGPFIQDDWRVRPNLTLSLGLRYETQGNTRDRTDFAPRFAFAWALGSGGSRPPKAVIRGGFGIFYERFAENFTLQANRFNGIVQRRFIVNTPDFFPSLPSDETLLASQLPQTVVRVADNLRTPYTIQSAFSVERQLPLNLTLSVSFINTRTLHALRSRNINAPLPETFNNGVRNGARPSGNVGNVFEYESSGRFNQNQLVVNINNRVNKRLSFFSTYALSKASSDTDGAGTFPADSYDLRGEYGRSGLDTRHRFVLVGVVGLPRGFSLNPFIVARSGLPFNITTGNDANGDTIFTERPALATDPSKPGVIVTSYGTFDPNPGSGQKTITRNFAEGPSFIAVNLRVSKVLGFGNLPGAGTSQAQPSKQSRQSGGEGQRSPNIYGNAPVENRYQLTLSVQIRNILNRTNLGLPVGNLSSNIFGRSNSLAPSSGFGISGDSAMSNRRVEAQIRFSF